MLKVGLTGLIGSGKSTIADLFAKFGVPIIDTDLIAHTLTTANGKAIPQLAKAFGSEIVNADNILNRSKLRELIFTDDSKRIILEQILHPMILDQVNQNLSRIKQVKYVIIVVPLLFRSKNYLTLINRSIFVDCSYQLLLERLKKRNNLDKAQVDSILARQVDRVKQLSLANDIILNDGDLEQLYSQVKELHQCYILSL